MNARTHTQDWRPPSREEVVTYLTEPRAAILRTLWTPDGRSRATADALADAVADVDPEASLGSELEVLTAWNLVEEIGVTNGPDGQKGRYDLSARGEQVMDRHGGKIDPSALTPPEERTVDEWREYPVPIERKFAELAELFGELRARVDAVEDESQ